MSNCKDNINPFELPKGEPGVPGESGMDSTVEGPAGEDGTIWDSGEGTPSDILGVEGGFYFDSLSGSVYRKGETTWSLIFTFEADPGGDGGDGDDGLSFRSGVGVPPTALGIDGDSYVDTDSTDMDLYIKVGGLWVDSGRNLKGEPGMDSSSPPVDGDDGLDGSKLIQGSGEPDNLLGNDNDSYIDNTTGDLYLKVLGAWMLTGNIGSFADTGGSTMTDSENFGFRATGGISRTYNSNDLPATLFFENDSTGGFFDNGNNFFVNIYKNAKGSVPQRFIVENLTISNGGVGGTVGIEIVKNPGGSEEVLAFEEAVIFSTNVFIPSIFTDTVSLALDDCVVVRIYKAQGSTVDYVVDPGAVFSNSFEEA